MKRNDGYSCFFTEKKNFELHKENLVKKKRKRKIIIITGLGLFILFLIWDYVRTEGQVQHACGWMNTEIRK